LCCPTNRLLHGTSNHVVNIQMEKRALAAEERATEAVVMERKARAALEAREKQLANMRVRVSFEIVEIKKIGNETFWFAVR
jgi:hypothetical protein